MSRPRTTVSNQPFAGFQCGQRAVSVSPRSQQRTDVEFRLAESGGVTLLLDGRPHHLPARRLTVFWAGIPHQAIQSQATEIWSLRVPLEWLLGRQISKPFLHALLDGRVLFEPDVDNFQCDLFRLHLWSRDATAKSDALSRAAELELEARIARLEVALPKNLARPVFIDLPGERQHPRSVAIAELIALRHSESFSMTEFAAEIGLHRNYAMNLFRRELGTTLLEYLTQHRLAHAMRLMITTEANLKEIARRSGFGSLKRLEVTFRQSFKEPPAVFRRRLQRRAWPE